MLTLNCPLRFHEMRAIEDKIAEVLSCLLSNKVVARATAKNIAEIIVDKIVLASVLHEIVKDYSRREFHSVPTKLPLVRDRIERTVLTGPLAFPALLLTFPSRNPPF